MIKKYLQVLGLVFCLIASARANSQENSSKFKVAIVDVQAVLENSLAVQNIKESIDLISQNIQKNITEKEAELKKVEENLIKKRGTLNEEAFGKEVSEFNQKVSHAQKDMQNKKNRLDQAHSVAVGKVYEEITNIINALATANNFELVLPSSQLLFAKNDLNITPEVIKLLNHKLKTVKVDYK